jgi:hypothetical protein
VSKVGRPRAPKTTIDRLSYLDEHLDEKFLSDTEAADYLYWLQLGSPSQWPNVPATTTKPKPPGQ